MRTDAQGRFRYELPGGGPFHVLSRSLGSYFDLTHQIVDRTGRTGRLWRTRRRRRAVLRSKVTAKNPPKRTRPAGRRRDAKGELQDSRVPYGIEDHGQ